MKKRLALVIALILAITVLASCGNSAGPGATGGPQQSQPGGGDVTGPSKTVNLGISENLISLDPHNAGNVGTEVVLNFCFDALVLRKDDGTFEPMIAESWEPNDAGTEWTLHIREGITAHDGEVIDAHDVAFNFERLIEVKDTHATALLYWATLEGVELIDDYTVKVILSEGSASTMVSLSNTMIIPKDAYEKHGDNLFNEQIMTGTGPWIFEEWVDAQYARFTKNPNYWNKANYDPYYEEVYVRHVLEPSTAVAGHLSGDLNANIPAGGVNQDLIPLYAGTEDKINMYTMDTSAYLYLGLQLRDDHILSDKNVRKAFDLAIDRQSIVDNILGGGLVPNSILTQGTIGYDDSVEAYPYDPEAAKEYLANSSYNGEEIELSSNTSTIKSEEILLAMSDMLNQVGFNTKVSVVENATLLNMRTTGEYDVFMVIVMHQGGDPQMVLNQRILNDFHSSNYDNKELKDLVSKADKEFDAQKREELLKEITKIIREESAPHLAIAQTQATYAMDWGIKGLFLYPDGTLRLSFVDYDSSLLP